MILAKLEAITKNKSLSPSLSLKKKKMIFMILYLPNVYYRSSCYSTPIERKKKGVMK